MASDRKYSINLDTKFDYLELIDILPLVASCKEKWFKQTLCQVNGSVVRIGVVHGEFHWHKHDDDDEFFLVLDGKFLIDLEDQTVELSRHQGYTIPRGVRHRTRAAERAVMLMVEQSGVQPEGD